MIHGTNRNPLSPHAVFIFPYEVERLVDVCVCKRYYDIMCDHIGRPSSKKFVVLQDVYNKKKLDNYFIL